MDVASWHEIVLNRGLVRVLHSIAVGRLRPDIVIAVSNRLSGARNSAESWWS